MFYNIQTIIGALALIVASEAIAYDYGAKATAMQNIENRPSPSLVVERTGQIEKHYDKATVASLNRDNDARQARESNPVVVAESGGIRTQRTSAADVSYRRASVTERGASDYAAPQRSSANKPAYYATHDR